MMYRLITYVAASFLFLILSGGGNLATAGPWLSGAPADEPVAQWVKDIEHALNMPDHRAVFLNDPRTPMEPMVHLFNRAARAWEDKNLALAKDFVHRAFDLLEQGIQKNYYTEADIEPVKVAVLNYLPADLSGHATIQPSVAKKQAKPQMPMSDQQRFAQQLGSPLGVPEPGTVMDQEETRKHPAKAESYEENAQMIEGGRYFVSGAINKIDGEYYFVRDDESGDEVRLLVNKDTNVDCNPAVASASLSRQPGARDQKASDRQVSQGQKRDETAMGSGFRIGSKSGCAFKRGDKIKAEISDLGTVTTLKLITDDRGPRHLIGSRSIGESAGTGALAIPQQDNPGQLDMTGPTGYPPKQYAIPPIPSGGFQVETKDPRLHTAVKSPDGKTIGSLETLIRDSNTGEIEYAEVLVVETGEMVVVPWAHFVTARKPGLILNTRHFQIEPVFTKREGQDRSTDIAILSKAVQGAIAPGDLRSPDQRRLAAPTETFKSRDTRFVSKEAPKGEVVRGEILDVNYDQNQLVLKDEESGKEVLMRWDDDTMKGHVGLKDESFKAGDEIEAYVAQGHAESISLMREQGNSPNDPEGGG